MSRSSTPTAPGPEAAPATPTALGPEAAPGPPTAPGRTAAPGAPTARVPPTAHRTLITSRPLDEYCGIFGLTRSALAALPGPVLDCPGGAAGLAAEARALGCEVIAADPLYAVPVPALTDLAVAGRNAMADAVRADPARHLPAAHRRPEKYLRSWDRARTLFAADAGTHPDRYVAAALPALPFADHTFALTLSSYLLFAYPELFPPAAQLAALLELVRVTAPDGEVRVHPLFDGSGTGCPHLPGLRSALGRHRVGSEIRRCPTPGRPGRTHRVLILRTAARRAHAARIAAGALPLGPGGYPAVGIPPRKSAGHADGPWAASSAPGPEKGPAAEAPGMYR